jgi:hypothetical protein
VNGAGGLTLRGLSCWHPHAGLMAIGRKGVESRGRTFGHRGPLAIASTAGIPQPFRSELRDLCRKEPFRTDLERAGWHGLDDMPRSVILAVVWVDTETRITGDIMRAAIAAAYGAHELRYGNYADGRVAIHTDPSRLMRLPEPVPCKGSQGLWYVPANILGQLAVQLRPHPNFHFYRDAFGAFARDTSEPIGSEGHTTQPNPTEG